MDNTVNREQALRALEVATAAFNKGDFSRALRMALKSQQLR